MATLLNVNNYNYRRGGADVMYLEQCELFERLGWNVARFSMHHPQNEPSPWSKYFVDEVEEGRHYSFAGNVVRAGRVVYSLQARSRLRALLDDTRPDVAHLHNVYHHISPSVLSLLRERQVPTVLTTHDLKIACPAYQMMTHDGVCERCKGGKLYNVALNRCIKGSTMLSAIVFAESSLHRVLRSYTKNVDRFVTPSRFYVDKFAEWGFDADQFVHIPNYVHVDDFQPGYAPGEAFVYFGRLSREKGLHTLVRAAAASRVPLWLIGTGPDEAHLQRIAAELGADVTFYGYLTGAALHDRVKAARATVLPSEWYENAPVSVLESYALGKPLIGADIGGISELVREGETGYTFASGDVDALAGVLRDVADLPDDDVADLGRRGRAWMETDYTSQRYVERITDLYRQLGVDYPPSPDPVRPANTSDASHRAVGRHTGR